MKLRTGFVSNSSSSSFVAIGYFITKEEIKDEYLYEKAAENDLYYYQGSEGGLKNGEIAIAKEIYTVSSDEMSINEARFSFSEFNNELNKEAEKVKEFLAGHGINVTSEPKLFSGTRCS